MASFAAHKSGQHILSLFSKMVWIYIFLLNYIIQKNIFAHCFCAFFYDFLKFCLKPELIIPKTKLLKGDLLMCVKIKAEAKIHKLAYNFKHFKFSLKALAATLMLALHFRKSPNICR